MRYIAIDTEYLQPSVTIKKTRHSRKCQKLYCIAATSSDERTWKYWLNKPFDVLTSDDIHSLICSYIENIGYEDGDTFIAHSVEIAEGMIAVRLFNNDDDKFIQTHIKDINIIDTYLLAQQVKMTLDRSNKESDKPKCSYAALVKEYLGIEIDSNEKDLNRQRCIEDKVEGYEDEIMEYCLHDTQYLIPLYFKLRTKYIEAIKQGTLINGRMKFDPLKENGWIRHFNQPFRIDELKADKMIINISRKALVYSIINNNGFPVDSNLVKNIDFYQSELKNQLADGNGDFIKNGKINTKNVERELTIFLKQYDKEHNTDYFEKWPRTKTGLSTSKAEKIKGIELKELCKEGGVFEGTFIQRLINYRTLRSLPERVSNYYKYHLTDDSTLFYYDHSFLAQKTGRCSGKPSLGFIPQGSRVLDRLYKAPPGKIFFEVDLGAAETYIAGKLCHDKRWQKVYGQKDTYLYVGTQIEGRLRVDPKDYATMSKDELKVKYKKQRKRLKDLVLGMQYGSGKRSISGTLGISEDEAADILNQFKPRRKTDKVELMKAISLFQTALINNKERKPKAIFFKEGFLRMLGDDPYSLTVGNLPFQGGCAMILFETLEELIQEPRLTIHGTQHDAILCSCDIADYGELVQLVVSTFQEKAKEVLSLDYRDDPIRVDVEFAIKDNEFVKRDSFIEKFFEQRG